MSHFLAVDGGASVTRAGLYAADGTLLKETSGGACNPIEYGVDACVETLVSLTRGLTDEPLAGFAAGISGAKQESFRRDIARGIRGQLEVPRVAVTDDLHPILYANAGLSDALLVIAGTGSSVLAQAADGRSIIVGGRGRLFGDDGSAYQIAVSGLRAAARASDGMGDLTGLATALPKAAGADSLQGLVPWSAGASKQEVAALAKVVDALAAQGDSAALECVVTQAERLAEQTWAASRLLALPKTAACYLNGGVFNHSRLFRDAFKRSLAQIWPEAKPDFPPLLGHRAVLEMATTPQQLPEWASVCTEGCAMPATERTLPQGICLDRLNALEIVRAMNREDAKLAGLIARKAPQIAEAIEAVARAFARSGRLIYIGAGTSGRLGVLDASECPPTFGVPSDRVMGIIAGGPRALSDSAEGGEDNAEQGERDVERAACSKDTIIGIAASGRTPYTLAALRRARALGAATVLVCCNAGLESPADITIAIETGAEALPGSTRLKAGTATKMVLNMISTGAMALSGYIYEGRMVGVRPTNHKLRARAVRIIADLTRLNASDSEDILDAAGGSIAVATIMARKGIDAAAAAALLENAGGRLRDALEQD